MFPFPDLTWRVHKVEMHKVVNAKLLQLQNYSAQVGPEDLWISVLLHLSLVCLLYSVKTSAVRGRRVKQHQRVALGVTRE